MSLVHQSLPRLAVASLAGVLLSAPAAHAFVTELRLIERTGQAVATPSDGVLNFAVQARVLSAGNVAGLANSAFSITIVGESESSGTLSRDRTSNADGTYFSGIAGPAGGGTTSGLAQQYGFIAGINAAFNGLINSSAASWTQTSAQDIGLIGPVTHSQNFLNVPGVDTDADGNPDSAVGAAGTLPGTIMHDYFGAGDWVDVYRFRYTLSNFANRTLNFVFGGDAPDRAAIASAFTGYEYSGQTWHPTAISTAPADLRLTNFSIPVIPAPTTAGAVLPGLALLSRRRR